MSIFSNSKINSEIFSERYKSPKGSSTLNAAANARELKEKYNVDIVSLTLGQPDGEPTVKKPSKDIDNKYAPVQGKPELRKKIAEFESRVRGVDISFENIHLTNGGKQALDNVFTIFLSAGDKVLTPDVKWVSYEEQIIDAGAKQVNIDTQETGLINPESLKKALQEHKPKMALINSPSNPTGNVYSQQEREEIMKICNNYLEQNPNFILLCDDIYKTIVLEGEYLSKSIFDNSSVKAGEFEQELMSHGNIVYADGFAKGFKAMGWRVGYVIASSEVIERVKARQGNVCSGISNASQQLALDSLGYVFENPSYFTENNKIFKERRDYFYPLISNLEPFEVVGNPSGAFYIFTNVTKSYGWKIPNKITDVSGVELKVGHIDPLEKTRREDDILYIPETISSAQNLADYLLYVAHVGTVAQDKNYIRFSYATDIGSLGEAIDRLKQAIGLLVK